MSSRFSGKLAAYRDGVWGRNKSIITTVIATSVLSKRWRFLWTSVPVLDFGDWFNVSGYEVILSSITNSLIQYRSQKINKFRVYFDCYNLRQQDIDTWIRFAVNRDVKEFDLSLLHKDDWEYELHMDYQEHGYKLLGCLLNCESLEVLKLSFCILNLNVSSSSLRLLKKLELHFMWLSNLDTSGCPLLESIILCQCNLNQPLNIYAPNPKLGFLKIKDIICDHPVTLFAPNLKSIQFDNAIRGAYNIMNLSSLTTVSFQLLGGFVVGQDTLLMELLQGLLHASTLRLNHGFMELLSFLDTGVKLPPCRSTCLELKINMQKSDIIGMAHILRSAHSLETLILDICSNPLVCYEDQHLGAWDYGNLWETLGHSLSSIRSLKNVEIKNFLESEADMLYKELGPKSSIETFLVNNWDKEIELVKTLLKNCMILETMNISTIYIPSRIVKSEVLLRALTKRLLTFPRASTKAEIYFSLSPK